MKENTVIVPSPSVAAKLSKEEIMATLEKSYVESKPLNDSLVDISLRIQALTGEIYRRSILKQCPGVRFSRVRTVMKVSASVHPNTGLPKIAERLAALAKEGVVVTDVRYDENTGEFSFYSDPEFKV